MTRFMSTTVVGVCILLAGACTTYFATDPPEQSQAANAAKVQAPSLDTPGEKPEVQAAVVPPRTADTPREEEPGGPPPVDAIQREIQEEVKPDDKNEDAGPIAIPPPVPSVADGDMEVTAAVTFEDDDANTPCTTDSGDGLGLEWSIVDGAARYAGTTRPSAPGTWLGNSFQFPVGIDVRAKLEISGEFRVAHSDGYHIIALWAPADMTASRLCMYYSGSPGRGRYVIQTHWMNMKTTTTGKRSLPAFGDEKDVFHRMRMLLDRNKKEVSYYVDEILLGTVSYEGERALIESVGMDIETPRGGTKLDIRYDNIKVRSFGPLY